MPNEYVRIAFTLPENELTTEQKAAREWLSTTINQALTQWHEAMQISPDFLEGVEVYPCMPRRV